MPDPLSLFFAACAEGLWTDAAECFDLTTPQVCLIPETADRCLGGAAVRAYWETLEDAAIEYHRELLLSRPLTQGMIANLYRAEVRRMARGTPAATASRFNLFVVLRPEDSGWRILLMAESPLAPFLELTAAYERAALREGEPSW